MDEIKFVHLFEVKEEQIIDLMNNEMVGKQLPLLVEGFSAEDCRTFLKAKKQLWDEHGFGPWAFLIKGEFAGWGDFNRSIGKLISPWFSTPNLGDVDARCSIKSKIWRLTK